jgi:Ca-activated chloride channel family protein
MPENPAPEGTEDSQTDSSGKLEASNEQPVDTESAEPNGSLELGDEDGKLMTQQEAMKMLQAIRDRDLLRRYQHERSERSRYIPVERDW